MSLQRVSFLAGVLAMAAGAALGATDDPRSDRTAVCEGELLIDDRPFDGDARVKIAITRGRHTLWTIDGDTDADEPERWTAVLVENGRFRIDLGALGADLPRALLDDPAGAAVRLWIATDPNRGGFALLPSAIPLRRAGAPDAPTGLLPEEDEDDDDRTAGDGDEPQTPGGREEYERLRRNNTDPEDIVRARLEAMKQLSAQPQPEDAGLTAWEWLGPGNVGGRSRSLVIDPNDPDRMWFGAVSGGIWSTTDGGSSWTPNDDFLPSLQVSTLAMDPNDSDVIYAGTGESVFAVAIPGAGVLKTTDGGATWNQLPTTASWVRVSRLSHHPTNSGTLLASIGYVDGQGTRRGQVWRTLDGGSSWNVMLNTTGYISQVEYSDADASMVGASTMEGELWLSTQGGNVNSWTQLATGGQDELPNVGERVEFEFADDDGTTWIYASLDRNEGEIWRSTDAGATWQLRNTLGHLKEQGWYDNALWVDPLNPNNLIAGGIDLWRSTLGAQAFVKISSWPHYHLGLSAHADHHFIVEHPDFDGTTNRTVFFCNDGGVQRANDFLAVAPTGGWTNLANGLGVTQFYKGAAAPDGSVILGGAQDNDTLRYQPSGGPNGWYQASTGDGGYCAIDFDDPSIMYDEFIYLLIAKSTDGGDSYSGATSGIADAGDEDEALFIAPFVMDPNDSSTLIAGGTSIWRTTNQASTWSSIRPKIASGGKCSAIAVAPSDSNVIWVGYDTGHIAYSDDNGANWTPNHFDVPDRFVTDIAIHPWNPDEVFVTLGGYNADNVWYTTDSGSTWEQRTGADPFAVPSIQVNTVTFHPAEPDWVYVGTDLGVLTSADRGLNWSTMPLYPGVGTDGPANLEVTDLFWQGGQFLVAATFGRGMFRAHPLEVLYVDQAYVGIEEGSLERPFDTLTEALAVASANSLVMMAGGTYPEAPQVVALPIEIRVRDTSAVVN